VFVAHCFGASFVLKVNLRERMAWPWLFEPANRCRYTRSETSQWFCVSSFSNLPPDIPAALTQHTRRILGSIGPKRSEGGVPPEIINGW